MILVSLLKFKKGGILIVIPQLKVEKNILLLSLKVTKNKTWYC
jgi:hypothetical protein